MENNIIEDNILSVNTQNSRMKIISIEGNEKQESQDGTSNLLVLEEGSKSQNGITVTVENGKVTISGTATANTQLIIGKAYLHEGETYYIEKHGTSSNTGFRLQDSGSGTQHWFATSGESSFVAETTGEYDFYISTNSGQTSTATNLKLRVSKESEIEWEQGFINTPSFDYPSEVKAVGDNINVFNDEAYKGFVVTQQNYNALEKVDLKLEANKYYVAKIYFEDGTSVAVNNSNFMLCAYKADGTQSANIPNGIAKTYANATELVKAKIVANATGLSTYANKVIKGIKIEEVADADGQPSPYSDYNQGCIELNIVNKNFLDIEKNTSVEKGGVTVKTDENGTLTLNGTTESDIYIQLNNGFTSETKYWTKKHFKANSYVFSCENLSNNQDLNVNAYVRENAFSNKVYATLARVFNQKSKNVKFNLAENINAVVYLWIHKGITLNNAKLKFQIELDNATDIVANEEQNYIITVQQRMFSGDKFIKVNGKWKEMHTWLELFFDGVNRKFNQEATNTSGKYRLLYHMSEKVKNCDTTNGTKAYCSNSKLTAKGATYSCNEGFTVANNIIYMYVDGREASEINAELQDNPITFYIPLQEDSYQYLDCTPEQVEILDKIIYLYDGISNIYFEDDLSPTIEVEIKKIVEDYDAYISTNGYLIIPEYNIKYLINLNESTIPSMPEATEASVKAAGRDGDIVLNTTYEPIPFDIVCYTEDNLTQTEKLNAEKNINKFLNSIKNKTINIAFENNNTFYKVKYSGALVITNYPKHLKFAIPLKSSDSYGKDLIQKSIVGNNTEESDTIEDVGALFIIRGPALNPIISLNDYSMEYTTSILEGASVEIDTSKSTITNVNNDGIRTNVMKYYNHQFPKIQNGINTLKILSGIDNDKNVIVTWNDLKL